MGVEKLRRVVAAPGLNVGGSTQYVTTAIITSAQLLALNATPQIVVPAPSAGLINILLGAMVHKPAGTAYGGIASGEDLQFSYTNGAGLALAQVETTGFLDQATAQTRWCWAYNAASGISSLVPVANAPIVLSLLVGEITTGDSPLRVRSLYMTMAADLLT